MKCCLVLSLATMILVCGCNSSGPTSGDRAEDTIIRVEGSDTMVNLAQAWAEEYNQAHPDVSIQVSGGGSGVGIASLIDGVTDIANSSRKMKPKEIARAVDRGGVEPQSIVVAMDALAVYVHKDNPLDSISIDELAEIYGDGASVTKWSQLGVENKACSSDEITRVSRQNNSGTYHYFREAVLGKARDYQLGSIDLSGSKDVVALVSRTPCAIGYSGMGYKTDEVNWLKIKTAKDQEVGVEPSVATAADEVAPQGAEGAFPNRTRDVGGDLGGERADLVDQRREATLGPCEVDRTGGAGPDIVGRAPSPRVGCRGSERCLCRPFWVSDNRCRNDLFLERRSRRRRDCRRGPSRCPAPSSPSLRRKQACLRAADRAIPGMSCRRWHR